MAKINTGAAEGSTNHDVNGGFLRERSIFEMINVIFISVLKKVVEKAKQCDRAERLCHVQL